MIEIAEILSTQGKNAEAEQLFAKTGHEHRNNPAFLVEWSRVLFQLGKISEGRSKLEEAEKTANDNAGELEVIARNLEAHGEISDAVKAYRAAYAKDPTRTDVLKPYADALALRLDREAPTIAKQKNDTSETHDGDMKGQAQASSRKSGVRRPAGH